MAQDSSPLSGPTRMLSPADTAIAAARGADAGIHYRHMHGGRKIGDRLREDGGAAADVAGLHQMGDVDDPRRRRDPGSHTVAGRNEPVLKAVVGQEAHIAIGGHDWPAYDAGSSAHSDQGHRPARKRAA